MAVLTDKKALANWKRNRDLHVLLVMDQEGVTKAIAEVQAYHEGISGLASRRAPAPSQGD